jgi:hypothetical protein
VASNPATDAGVSKATSASASASATDADEKWVKKLSPADQVAYRKARLAWGQAKATYEAARATAQVGADKPTNDFNAARDAYDAVLVQVGDAKKAAGAAKGDITTALGNVDPAKSDDPVASVKQLADLQAAVDAYKAAVQAVSKKVGDLAAAQAALAKLADPQPVFDRDKIKVNSNAVALANDQYQLDVATAEIPRNAAEDVYQEATATLQSHLEPSLN